MTYLIDLDNDAAGLDDSDDDEEAVAIDPKRGRKSSLASRKLDKEEPDTKTRKKKPRVLVEVRVYGHFY